MSEPKVSIIIPTMNIASYIGDMLSDLLAQSVSDIEIICVDGESTDGTADIISDFTSRDERVRFFTYAKPGVSAARNYGLKKALGRYVIFADGDDRVDKDYVRLLLTQIAQPSTGYLTVKGFPRINAQLGVCGYSAFDEEGELFDTPESGIRVLSKEDMLCRIFYLSNYQGYLWNKIFRRDIIEKCHIRFMESAFYHEDQLFLGEYLRHIDAVRMTSERPYHYRMRDDSAMGVLRSDKVLSLQTIRRRMTGVAALSKLYSHLKAYPDARWLCGQNLVFASLNIFDDMKRSGCDDRDFATAPFRRIAIRCRFIEYEPSDRYEARLLKGLYQYGITGRIHL